MNQGVLEQFIWVFFTEFDILVDTRFNEREIVLNED